MDMEGRALLLWMKAGNIFFAALEGARSLNSDNSVESVSNVVSETCSQSKVGYRKSKDPPSLAQSSPPINARVSAKADRYQTKHDARSVPFLPG